MKSTAGLAALSKFQEGIGALQKIEERFNARTARGAVEPDRLGDAIRALAAQMDQHGVEHCRIGVRVEAGRVAVFDLRRIGTTDRWERGDSLDRTLRLGGVLVVDPR